MAVHYNNDTYEEVDGLYRADSKLIKPNVDFGFGLFAAVPKLKGKKVATFIGEFITYSQGDARTNAGFGGYMIRIREDRLLDCFNYRDICMASLANSPAGARVNPSMKRAKANCTLVVRSDRAYLVAKRIILPGEEILWSYGNLYVMPMVVTP
jgi:hypothetical protein